MKVNDGNVYLEDDKKVITEKVIARDSSGLLLQDDGGNYIKIEDGGIVTISKNSGGGAYLAGSQSVTEDEYIKVNIDTAEWDFQDEFDDSNHRFTATESGYYLVMACAAITSLVDLDPMYSNIRKNGASTSYIIWPMGRSSSPGYVICDIVQLDANDYIEIWVRHGYSSSRTATAGIQANFLTFQKLS